MLSMMQRNVYKLDLFGSFFYHTKLLYFVSMLIVRRQWREQSGFRHKLVHLVTPTTGNLTPV